MVDNDDLHQELLTSVLSLDGHMVKRASDGLQALAMCRESRPDLILTELIMPRLDGLAFLERLRQEMPNVPPVIVISAYEDRKSSILAMMQGAGEVFAKPFNVDALLEKVRSIFSQPSTKRAGDTG